jgi:hypothetical protein
MASLRAVALIDIQVIKDVEAFVQNMSRTAGKVGRLQFFQVFIVEDAFFGCWL